MRKLVQGVGTYEAGQYSATIPIGGGKTRITKEYSLWFAMLQRCYSTKCQVRQPTYAQCSVSNNFKNFQWFADWCQSQVGFGLQDYHLDKDILTKGNKVYSEHDCVFIPVCINSLLTKREAQRGVLPVGVSFYPASGKYCAQLSIKGNRKNLGYFTTPQEAFIAYKAAKEGLIRDTAREYKDKVDVRVYAALTDYVVEITD